MTLENEDTKAPRDRSPSFPFISLPSALDRLADFEQKFGRHSTPAVKVGIAWKMKENGSQAQQTLAALKYFGLVDYEGIGVARKVFITENGRNYLRAQQEETKKKLLKIFALLPKEIEKFWMIWGVDRPIDTICLDTLVIENKYNDKAAPQFLKVYDDTISFAGLVQSNGNLVLAEESDIIQIQEKNNELPAETLQSNTVSDKKLNALSDDERILQDGILSQTATYRIIVSGKIGVKEIERLIKKLELDKEILAEPTDIE